MKHFKKIMSFVLILAFLLVPVSASAVTVPEKGTSLTGYTVILHTNDSHGRVTPDSAGTMMGFTAVSAMKKHFEAAGAQVILLDAGDTLHGLPFANLTRGESIVSIMNKAGYDAMTPGNHDFNYGTDRLLELSKEMKFPLLSSNVKKKSDSSYLLKDHIIIEKNGIKFGVFGLSTPETTYKTNPNNVADVDFTDPVAAAEKEVAELRAEGAWKIIALSHLGTDEASEVTSKLVAQKVSGIDLIIDGHSHSVYETGLMVGSTLIASTGEYLKNIGVVMIAPNGDTKADLINATEFAEKDADIDQIISTYTTDQEKILSANVGYTEVELDGVREHVRAGETNLGDLTCDAFRWATGAQVAVTNGGGIRASIDVGDITKKELVTVFPFGNYVVTKKVTGKALVLALEHGVSTYPNPLGAFLQVSGITFTLDPSKPAGSRVSDVKVNGAAIDPEGEYLLATNDFVIVGGDGYTMFKDFKTANEYGSIEDILSDYLNKNGHVTLNNEKRINVLSAGQNTETQEPKTEEPKTEEPKTEEPKTEEPKTEEPKTEEPKTEEPKTEEPKTEEPEAENNTDKKPGFTVYIVVKGDCLSTIAKKQLGKGSDWKLIYEWNKGKISNPDLIYAGQKLKIFSDKK